MMHCSRSRALADARLSRVGWLPPSQAIGRRTSVWLHVGLVHHHRTTHAPTGLGVLAGGSIESFARRTGLTPTPRLPFFSPTIIPYKGSRIPRAPPTATATMGSVMIETSLGEFVVDLYADKCPLAAKNFIKLCKAKYYNGVLIYNVQQNFMIQTGDPTGTCDRQRLRSLV